MSKVLNGAVIVTFSLEGPGTTDEGEGIPGFRVKLNCPVVVGYGTVALASQILGKTPGTEAGCALGIQFDRSVEVLDCPVILAFVEIDISAKQVATGIGWEELDGFLVVFDC